MFKLPRGYRLSNQTGQPARNGCFVSEMEIGQPCGLPPDISPFLITSWWKGFQSPTYHQSPAHRYHHLSHSSFFWPKMAWQANIECDILNEMEIMWQGCARFRQSGCADMCRRISARGLHFGCSCSSQSETGSTPTATTASTLHL